MRGKWEGVNEPHWLEIEGPFRAPKGTRLLTPRDLLSRDSESFGRRFRGAGGTIKVPIGPQKLAIETESAAATERLPKTLAGKAENAKRREDSLSALSVNPSGPFFRRKVKSSPSRTRTYNKPVNSRHFGEPAGSSKTLEFTMFSDYPAALMVCASTHKGK
jgi:hypothetical protein